MLFIGGFVTAESFNFYTNTLACMSSDGDHYLICTMRVKWEEKELADATNCTLETTEQPHICFYDSNKVWKITFTRP